MMSPLAAADGRRERWLSIFLSVLVHASVVGVLGWGWWRFRAPKPVPQQLAIEATVVVDRPTAVTPTPAAASTPAPEPVAPVPDHRAEQQQEKLAQRQQEQRAEAQVRHEREQEQEQQKQEQQKQQEQQQRQEAQALKVKEAAARAAREKAKRESELRAQLAAEERVNAARGSAQEAAWLSLIRDRVTRAWIRPPSARAGVNCEVHVTQIPGGVVTGVQIGSCNGDQAVRESIEAAVYRASPLPTPSNPDLFDRSLVFNFHPDE